MVDTTAPQRTGPPPDAIEALYAASREGPGVAFSMEFVRMAGDLLGGIFLSRLVHWFGPDDDGACLAQDEIPLDDRPWIARSDDSWFDETAMTTAQIRRQRAVFEQHGWIECRTARVGGTPKTHITVTQRLADDLEDYLASGAVERRARMTLTRTTAPPREGFVYVVAAPSGEVKIGFSAHLYQRLGNLDRQTPGLVLLHHFAGTMADEAALHRRFASCRVHGEWFEPDTEMQAWLDGLAP